MRALVLIARCMERGSEMVQAVEFPAVTTARASGDYHPPSSNWFLGCGKCSSCAISI
jgi:hypothetical protein